MFERALSWARGFVLVLPVLLPGCYDGAPAPEVAPAVDLQRFTGKWYEIAKLPRTTEAHCTGTVATYQRRSDGDLEMTSQCRLDTLDGPSKSVTAIAKIPDPAVPAKLALAVGGFYGDYWILEVGTNYEYAVIGHPSREYLWILSRTPKLADDALSGALKRARVQKFNVDRLEYTLQASE